TCHNNPSGGGGCGGTYPVSPYGHCWNIFGADFGSTNGYGGRIPGHVAYTWDAALRNYHSDRDSWTNGQEPLNPAGAPWTVGRPDPAPSGQARYPGFAPTQTANVPSGTACGYFGTNACAMNECTLDPAWFTHTYYQDCDTSPAATCNELDPTYSCSCPQG